MPKGEIPWIYNEAFEPRYFSFAAVEKEPIDKEEPAAPEAEDYQGFISEVF